jgi:hypothetical protein
LQWVGPASKSPFGVSLLRSATRPLPMTAYCEPSRALKMPAAPKLLRTPIAPASPSWSALTCSSPGQLRPMAWNGSWVPLSHGTWSGMVHMQSGLFGSASQSIEPVSLMLPPSGMPPMSNLGPPPLSGGVPVSSPVSLAPPVVRPPSLPVSLAPSVAGGVDEMLRIPETTLEFPRSSPSPSSPHAATVISARDPDSTVLRTRCMTPPYPGSPARQTNNCCRNDLGVLIPTASMRAVDSRSKAHVTRHFAGAAATAGLGNGP